MTKILPITAVIATSDRPLIFRRTLLSLFNQIHIPAEIVVVDSSKTLDTFNVCKQLNCGIIWQRAIEKGAAVQRMQGLKLATNDFIFFMDDDILFELNCVERLWNSLIAENNIGGVNAMITNQKYQKPGRFTRFMYWFMNGKKMNTYAGMCIGPVWNLLPEDSDDLPLIQSVQWLNLTCTMYRKRALPQPLFLDFFTGYSLLEDVYLSLEVGKKWNLFNVRDARIFHDSQPGDHKNNIINISKMSVVNRFLLMKHVFRKVSLALIFKFIVLELVGVFSSLMKISEVKKFPSLFYGKMIGFITVIRG